jgi:hypothetical protein
MASVDSSAEMLEPDMWPFLHFLLQGTAVRVGQAVPVEWLNRRQLLVVTKVVGGGDADVAVVHRVAETTEVSFAVASSMSPELVRTLHLEWLQLPPQPLPAPVDSWVRVVCKQLAGMQPLVQRLAARMHPGAASSLPVAD